MFSLEDGKLFVKTARRSIEYFLHTGRLLGDAAPKKDYLEKLGVFVSLHTCPGHGLRGCIGYPEPVAPFWNALIGSAVNAAFKDPRFPQLSTRELGSVVIEVSVLSKPVRIEAREPGDCLSKIEIGKDGLIVEKGHQKGLLLPQVAPEFGWSAKEFLQHTCLKAGLDGNAWEDGNCRLYSFRGRIFREKKPKGGVVEGYKGKAGE